MSEHEWIYVSNDDGGGNNVDDDDDDINRIQFVNANHYKGSISLKNKNKCLGIQVFVKVLFLTSESQYATFRRPKKKN